MKKLLTLLCAVTLVLGLAITSSATPIYYEADNVLGTGTINYGYTLATINNAPEFSFAGAQGTVDENLADFLPGEYTIDFKITNLAVDANEDGHWFPIVADYSFTTGPITIPSIPPVGTYGALSWNVNPSSGFWVSYDFDYNPGPNSNQSVNSALGVIDYNYSGARNGVMTANIRWDTLRVELNSTAPVPEPSTLLLMGIGLLGLVGYSRKRSKKG